MRVTSIPPHPERRALKELAAWLRSRDSRLAGGDDGLLADGDKGGAVGDEGGAVGGSPAGERPTEMPVRSSRTSRPP